VRGQFAGLTTSRLLLAVAIPATFCRIICALTTASPLQIIDLLRLKQIVANVHGDVHGHVAGADSANA
jgi:hypothetical protein